ncbi:MAG: Lrp/AsnC family transcriptional regulator [Candidatus Eremiobacteraeota bacterium]|nr:Lrp/AsnC family transcriptional regulator [Candidatus Eremiobacteraeota bacterium]
MIAETGELDELDLQLLDALQRNARSTFAELGSIVGLKPPAVHDRVKRLEGRGYVRGYSAQLDSRLLGLELIAFVSCYTTPECAYDDFTGALAQMPEVCEVHSVAGEESFVLKIMTRSTAHLDDVLSRLKAVKGMARTKTTIVLSTPFERGGISVR